MRLTLTGHPTVGEAVAFLDQHCCRGEATDLLLEEALSRLPRSEAAALLVEAASRVAPGGSLTVRDVGVFAAAGLVADGHLDEAVLTDRRSFWTPGQAAAALPPYFRLRTTRQVDGGFVSTFERTA